MAMPAGQLELLLQYAMGGNPLKEQPSGARRSWADKFREQNLLDRFFNKEANEWEYKLSEKGKFVVERVLVVVSEIVFDKGYG